MAGVSKQMSPRERVMAAIEGKPIDRVPVMYWLNPHAAVRMMAEYKPAQSRLWNLVAKRMWKKFRQGGEMDAREIWRALPLLYTVYANNSYALELGADMAQVPYGTAKYWGKVYRENGRIRAKDVFGATRGMGGIYLDVIEPGVKNADDLANLPLPDATGDDMYAPIRKFRKEHPDACIFTDNFGVQDLPTSQIWEMSKMMMAMIDYPDKVKKFQQRFGDYMIDIGIRSIRAGADLIFMYDDYGYTGRTLISMDMWKEFTFPHLKRMIAAFHEEGGKVMLHSCGFQMPFLPYYMEAELDVLQAFQPKAGNDFAEAYHEYGDRLTFNAGIDVQQGESMTPEQLKRDIIGACRIGGLNGRHILGMTHMLQYTMPMENMRAIFETVREIQQGLHDN
jgi:uroporphyrinogen decarboxylase